jgi:hypothetical protein
MVLFRGLKFAGKTLGGAALAGGPVRRGLVGAGVGGIVGAVEGSDFENPNLRAESIFKGAMIGAGVGGLIGMNRLLGQVRAGKPAFWQSPVGRVLGGTPSGIRSFMSGTWSWNQRMGEAAARRRLGDAAATLPAALYHSPVAGAVKTPFRAASWAINHPLAAAGIGGGAYLAGSYMMEGSPHESPTMEDSPRLQPNYQREALAASLVQSNWMAPMGSLGTAPQMMGPMQQAMRRSTDGLVQGLNRGRHG